MNEEPATNSLLLDMLRSGANAVRDVREASTFNAGVTRRGFIVVQKSGRDFMSQPNSKTWITMPGLRGIGKTTILAQLYGDNVFDGAFKIYASFDRIKTIGATIQDFITACEDFMGATFEEQTQPVALFLDEVQYLDNWAIGLKTVLDRSRKIFIFSTGSSALNIQSDANVARRMDIIKLHPLCFTEYVLIRQAHDNRSNTQDLRLTMPIPGLANTIRDAIFASSNAADAYEKLFSIRGQVNQYWASIPYQRNALFGEYLSTGTLPFTLDIPNQSLIWERINRILSESLDRDVTSYARFDIETISSIPQLLFLLASSSETSTLNLSRKLNVNQRTIRSVLEALEKTEIITAIQPKGAAHGKIGKASKYLFTSPAMRAALCGFGGVITPENDSNLRGKLLEDIVGLYLKRMFLDAPLTRSIVEYDTAKGGSDFIVSRDGTKANSISLEVGANKTSAKQAIQTMASINGKYAVVVTSGQLRLDATNNVLWVPFEYFFLM